jgi:uncharacterized protein YndB with AHSA1/START domain
VAYWILQANPKMYRVFSALSDATAIQTWAIAHHRRDIAPGDKFALWVSGKDSGVYAFGIVTERADVTPPDDAYWQDPAEGHRRKWRVGIRIEDGDVLGSPIPRGELSRDPNFAHALILRMPGGGNPFPLTESEWRVIISYRV